MTVNVDNIKAGFYVKMTGAANLMTLLPGGIHNIAAPSGTSTSYPLIVYQIITGNNPDDFTHFYESILFQVDIYAQDTASARAGTLLGPIAKQLSLALDNATLSITGYEFGCCRRVGIPIEWGASDSAEDDGIRRMTLEYRVEVTLLKSATV